MTLSQKIQRKQAFTPGKCAKLCDTHLILQEQTLSFPHALSLIPLKFHVLNPPPFPVRIFFKTAQFPQDIALIITHQIANYKVLCIYKIA